VFHISKFDDGKRITTSYVIAINGIEIKIKTYSGSTYRLGQPDPKYVDWCRENGHHVPTPEEPIKLR
jgi:hypothetical protein